MSEDMKIIDVLGVEITSKEGNDWLTKKIHD